MNAKSEKVTIKVFNSYSYVNGGSNQLYATLEEEFAIRPAGYKFMRAYREGRWDGKIRFFSLRYHSLPTGLLGKLQEVLTELGVPYEILDERKVPPKGKPRSVDIVYRDFQQECIEKALAAGRGIIQASTGFGKTEVALGIIANLGVPTTLFLVPSLQIFYQTYDRFKERLKVSDDEIGCIGDGEWNVRKITVATVQTLSRAIEEGERDVSFLKDVHLVIVDECHLSSAESYEVVLRRLPNAYWRFALSATAFTGDKVRDYKVIGYFGDMIVDVVCEYKRPTVYVFPVKHNGSSYPIKRMYKAEYRKDIVLNKERNMLIQQIAEELVRSGRKVMILVKQIEHGKILEEMIKGSKFISGGDDKEARKEKVHSDVIIATTCFLYGVDIPEISAVILGGAWKSKIANLQGIGRGMRKSHFHSDLVVVDFEDGWSSASSSHLYRHYANRMKYFRERGYEIKHLKVEDICQLGQTN